MNSDVHHVIHRLSSKEDTMSLSQVPVQGIRDRRAEKIDPPADATLDIFMNTSNPIWPL